MLRSPFSAKLWSSAGLLAGALALALEWACSRVDDRVAFAPLALGDRLIRLAPADAATFAIDTFGKTASNALAVAVTIAFVAVGALLPAVTSSGGRTRSAIAGAVFALCLFGASVVAPVRPSVLAAAVVAAASGLLYATSLRSLLVAADRSADTQDADRRRALLWVASSAFGLVLGGSLVGRLLRDGPDTAVALKRPTTPTPAPRGGGFPRVPGLPPDITPVADHYVVDIDLEKPSVDAGDWRLRIGGLVETPASLTFADLQRRFEVVEQVSVLTCISNPVGGPLIGNTAWTGVRLRDVLDAAGVQRRAVDVVFRGADDYDVSIPLARAMQSTALLALGQNGRPLTQEHGFPCRVRVPALYGMMNTKWVESIELVASNHEGYWAKRGWSEIGEVRTQSRIDTPQQAQAGEPTWIAGIAWAGDRGISGVEVSVDAGRSWQPAMLARPRSQVAWTRWAYQWTPDREGSVRVLCRASDWKGRRQDATERSPHPDGATGFHDTEIRVTS
ncbi:MAG: molybdopterin-dependent oxidoreductase [Thermoleophilia bacterium]